MFEKNLNSFEEFEQALRDLRKEYKPSSGFLFRGHQDSEFFLTTTLERHRKTEISLAGYYQIISRARPQIQTFTGKSWEIPQSPQFAEQLNKAYDPLLHNKISEDVYTYMIYLRHHGFPSPLLDWSQSPYVAAYFAFRSPIPPKSEKVSIYVYCDMPNGFGDVRGGSEARIIEMGPYALAHKRHFLQKCGYTLCLRYDNQRKQEYIAGHETVFSSSNQHNSYRAKFTLPWSERMRVLKLLDDYNLNAFSLFGSEEALMETMAIRELDLK